MERREEPRENPLFAFGRRENNLPNSSFSPSIKTDPGPNPRARDRQPPKLLSSAAKKKKNRPLGFPTAPGSRLSDGLVFSHLSLPKIDNLVPIRLDIELEGQRYKDAFTWNPNDPDSEVANFARRTSKDLKLPSTFITLIAQSIQGQLAEFRSFEGQDMQVREKIVRLKLDLRVNNTVIRDQFLWDITNFENDPEEFAKTFCNDLNIDDCEVAPAIAVSIREQLYELAVQSVASAKEYRMGKKGRRGAESAISSRSTNGALDVVKLFGSKSHSVVRKRKDWYLFEPVVGTLSNEEAEALNAREERSARLKKNLDEKQDS